MEKNNLVVKYNSRWTSVSTARRGGRSGMYFPVWVAKHNSLPAVTNYTILTAGTYLD